MAHGSGHEIEIKLRVTDVTAMRRRLRELGAQRGPRLHESNVLFDTPEQSLRRRGMLLRLRVERPLGRAAVTRNSGARRALLDSWIFPRRGRQPVVVTLKAPPAASAERGSGGAAPPAGARGAYKVRREIEFAAPDSMAFRDVLAALGFAPSFYYEKIRATYRLPRVPGVSISLDETPLGVFLELEGRPSAIDRARRALGYEPGDAILLSYGALYVAHCRSRGVLPRDMLFE